MTADVNSAFTDYNGLVPANNTRYNIRPGTYLANTSNGEYAGYSASIVANKSIEWIRKVRQLRHCCGGGISRAFAQLRP